MPAAMALGKLEFPDLLLRNDNVPFVACSPAKANTNSRIPPTVRNLPREAGKVPGLFARKPTRYSQQAAAKQFGHRIDEPGTADSLRRHIADYPQPDGTVFEQDALNGPVSRPHAVLDMRTLESGPRRCGTGQQPTLVAPE